MEITSKNGTKIEVEISGYQQAPKILFVSPKTIGGRTVFPDSVWIGKHPQGQEEGIQVRSKEGPIFINAAAGVKMIRDEIAKLPRKVYRITKKQEIIYADGWDIPVMTFRHEGHVNGASQSDIEHMLDNAGITDISVDDAQKMWDEQVAAKRAPYIAAAKEAGTPVEYRREMVECRDPREECSADIAITYMHEDGTMHTEYNHTW